MAGREEPACGEAGKLDMRSTLFFLVILIAAAVSFGCGSSPTAANTVSNGVAASGNTGAQGNAMAPGIAPPSANAPAPDLNAPSSGPLAMKDAKREIVEGPPLPPGTKPALTPAPDNSSISTTMGKDGSFIETRVYVNNPYFNKLEKTMNGKSESIRLYLRTGRVVSLPPGSIGATATATMSQLMDLAGIKAPVPKVSQTPAIQSDTKTKTITIPIKPNN